MGKVLGICPHCGEVVPVNDEKENGFCAKCGQALDTHQSILAYQASAGANSVPVSPVQEAEAVRSSTVQRRQAREQAAEVRARSMDASQKVQEMFEMCSNEQDFLMLRTKVLEMSIGDTDKASLLAALDSATKERLSATLEKAQEYEKSKESPMSLLLGCIFIVAIGFGIQHFFSIRWAGIVSVVFAALGFFGSMSDKLDKKKAEERQYAAALISAYREQGYKL